MAQPHILVVEDENIIALDIQHRLQALGYSVPAIASSGEEALQRAAAMSPDLVLLDIVLKGNMDGIEVAERFGTLDVPVVYLTAYADEKTLQRATATGPFGYLLKPFTNSQLRTTIETALHKHHSDRQLADACLTTKKLEAIGTLAGGIAHDYNNLLTAILGHLALARQYVQPQEPLFGHVSAAEKAAQRAADVTQQLLTFARGGAPVKQLIMLTPTLQEATQAALSDPNVQCVFSLATDLWSVEADRNQLKQVIHQLVRNAAQAMPQGGMLTVQAVNIPPREASPLRARGAYVRLAFTDQGEGIAAEHLDKIFDPYFTTKAHNSGFGLTTAYTIVQRHAGYMTVDSTPGVGTTIYVYLPAVPTAPPPSEVVTAPPTANQGRILIMDDEEVIRHVASQMLRQLGYTVESARDGAEAIALYRRAKAAGQPFTAILMDLTIPAGMGGKDTIAELRRLDPTVKAIVSSGYSNDQVMANFRQYGFSGVLAKPYQLAELQAVLQRVIGRND